MSPETPVTVVPGPGPGIPLTIDGFSDKRFLDVADILLAHCSLMPAHAVPLCYAGREFFPDHPFAHPSTPWTETEQKMSSILIEVGGNIMAAIATSPPYGIESYRWATFDRDREAGFRLIMFSIWPGALHVKAFLDGPPDFEPTARHLDEIPPYFGGSMRYAEFLRDAAGIDITDGVAVMNDTVRRLVRHVALEFPRLPKISPPRT
ncbi:MAG TPA: hypothetical protein VEG35_03250 [Burkholderiales bacterium]|nr:hypothetical protein [Burkholderiales bacterium]